MQMNKALLQCGGDQLLSEPVLQNAFTQAHCHQCKSNTQAMCENLFFVDLPFHSLFFQFIQPQFLPFFFLCKAWKSHWCKCYWEAKICWWGTGLYELCMAAEFSSSASVWTWASGIQPCRLQSLVPVPLVYACLGLLSLVDGACEEESSGNEMSWMRWMAMLEAAWVE